MAEKKLKTALKKSRTSIRGRLSRWLGKKGPFNDEFWEDWESALIQVDLGVDTVESLLDELKIEARNKNVRDPKKISEKLEGSLIRILSSPPAFRFGRDESPEAIMIVGVNGTGKTNTIAKLARRFQNEGKKVMLAAADTFRAAAIEQLGVWSKRLGAEIIRQDYGSDPAAVAYDALAAAQARDHDYLIIDTAGRIHTRADLMEELKKIFRVLEKSRPQSPPRILLVLDASIGQNGLVQAKKFSEELPLAGVILTKLDGTARGGIVVAVASQLKLPVVALGVGEGPDDLIEFEPRAFVEALLEE